MVLIMIPGSVKQAIADLASERRDTQESAYETLLAATADKVAWGDDAWDELTSLLSHKDNRARSIAGQTLCNLARSVPPERVRRDFELILSTTWDERFVTARHVLLSSWKIGLEHAALRKQLLAWFAKRFETSKTEKNGALIRYDILCATRSLFEATKDRAIKSQASALIAFETDNKYRKKYARAWRGLLT